MSHYADAIVSFLDPERKYIRKVLTRNRCLKVNNVYVKDLRNLSKQSIKDVIIIDDLMHSFALQIENGIHISSYRGAKDDNELAEIMHFLVDIADVSDVRPFVAKYSGICEMIKKYLKEMPKGQTVPLL